MNTPITLLRRSLSAALAVGSTGALLAGCGGGGSVTLNGAGASFPAAIYQRWFQELAAKGAQVNYQSVGSGAGVRQFIAGTVDFGASDVPMKPDEIAQVNRGVVQIPMTAGAIAVAYNHPGCELKLSQAQLVDIFLGKIRNFSEVGCEAKPIKVVHRSDGSGTTANFTAHLAAISPAWKAGPGVGKTVNWPLGIGAKGNEGVSAQLGQVEGGIGYVEVAYVKGDLQAAALTNGSGETLKPTTESETMALASIELGPELIGSNPNPDKGYPIVTFSWILLYKTGNADKLDGLKKVFDFTLSEGAQAMAPELGYVPLPPSVLAKGRERLASLEK
ncbi:MAG: phosphate ABC transporter substrate-binding protein PstS [Cyanobium sp. CZS 25K]|nr:phosphate ABC transporter substrate-binding protein PstS [Cyanobium sp. CZS25K]